MGTTLEEFEKEWNKAIETHKRVRKYNIVVLKGDNDIKADEYRTVQFIEGLKIVLFYKGYSTATINLSNVDFIF